MEHRSGKIPDELTSTADIYEIDIDSIEFRDLDRPH